MLQVWLNVLEMYHCVLFGCTNIRFGHAKRPSDCVSCILTLRMLPPPCFKEFFFLIPTLLWIPVDFIFTCFIFKYNTHTHHERWLYLSQIADVLAMRLCASQNSLHRDSERGYFLSGFLQSRLVCWVKSINGRTSGLESATKPKIIPEPWKVPTTLQQFQLIWVFKASLLFLLLLFYYFFLLGMHR